VVIPSSFHITDSAPLITTSASAPSHTSTLVQLTTGLFFVWMVIVSGALLQPLPSVPTKLIVVSFSMIGEMLVPFHVELPELHTYESAPLAFNVTLSPIQIFFSVDFMVTVGSGFTVIFIVPILVHPSFSPDTL